MSGLILLISFYFLYRAGKPGMQRFIGKRNLKEIPASEYLLFFLQAFAFALIATVVVLVRHYDSTVYFFSLYAEVILFGGGGLYIIAVIIDSVNIKLEKYEPAVRVALWFIIPLVLFSIDMLKLMLSIGTHY